MVSRKNKNYISNEENQKSHAQLLHVVTVQEKKYGEMNYIVIIKKLAIKMIVLWVVHYVL